jgi:hypothetical protein
MALASLYFGQPFYARLATPPAANRYKARFIVGDRSYTVVAGEKEEVKAMDAAPFIDNGRTYVPVRYLAYALDVPGDGVSWDEKSSAVKLSKDGVTVTLVIGEETGYINDQPRSIGVAPLLREGRTYLPARFVAEAFGYQVDWDAISQTVSIKNSN